MKMKTKNGSHRYDINRTRSRHGNKYSKDKKCLTQYDVAYTCFLERTHFIRTVRLRCSKN